MTYLLAFATVVGFSEMMSIIPCLSCLAHPQLIQVLCQASTSL